ncbi:hypothetical protein ACLB2K_046818 [Fragaria x ananassa]
MFQCDKGLWASMFAEKYLKNCSLFDDNYEVAADCSSTWRGIIFGAKLLRSNLKWRLGDGKSIKFWHDYWFPAGPLINFALPSAFINHAATVCDFWIEDGWDVHKLLDVVPSEIVNKIVNVPTDFGVSGSDTLIWGATANGKFSVKSTYNSLFDMSTPLYPQWNYIWRMKIPPKLKIFYGPFYIKSSSLTCSVLLEASLLVLCVLFANLQMSPFCTYFVTVLDLFSSGMLLLSLVLSLNLFLLIGMVGFRLNYTLSLFYQ